MYVNSDYRVKNRDWKEKRMAKKEYTLTISILASNRKDTLPKTLASIKPLLDNVSSELIIVDTGCDDELLAHIRQYTDKIIKFEWVKDFSKARNVGLEKAKGQWFMFIDDDEWFEDVAELVEFFNSKEKDMYGYGQYIIRNYTSMKGDDWTESVAGRMFQILEGTKFVDAVHERLINISGPTKMFSSYAHHYGYVYDTPEAKKAHTERNISMIQKQIAEEPYRARHYAHLAQEYCVNKEYDKVLELSMKGIEKADMSISENEKDLCSLYAMIVWTLTNQHKFFEAYEKGVEYISSDKCSTLGKFAIYEYMAISMQAAGEYEKALECTEKFFEYKKYFDENPEERYNQSAILVMEADSMKNILKTVAVGFASAICVQDEKLLEKYMGYVDFNEIFPVPDDEDVISKLTNMMRNTTRVMAWVKIAEEILKNVHLGNLFVRSIMRYKEEDIQGFYKIADIMAMTSSKHGYINYLRVISARDDIYTDRLTELYRKTIESVNDIICMDNEFWNLAISKGIDIGTMIEGTSSISNWMEAVDGWLKNIKVKELIERKQQLDRVMHEESVHMQYFDMGMAEALLMRKKLDGITIDKLEREIHNYIGIVLGFYKKVYKEEIFEKYPSMLPLRCRVALMLESVCNKKMLGDFGKLKEDIVELMPRFENILNKYEELS